MAFRAPALRQPLAIFDILRKSRFCASQESKRNGKIQWRSAHVSLWSTREVYHSSRWIS